MIGSPMGLASYQEIIMSVLSTLSLGASIIKPDVLGEDQKRKSSAAGDARFEKP